jgi:hypothetical protein
MTQRKKETRSKKEKNIRSMTIRNMSPLVFFFHVSVDINSIQGIAHVQNQFGGGISDISISTIQLFRAKKKKSYCSTTTAYNRSSVHIPSYASMIMTVQIC